VNPGHHIDYERLRKINSEAASKKNERHDTQKK